MRKLLFITIVFFALVILSCTKQNERHSVQYFISGESIMNVSCSDANGELLFINNVTSAWAYAFIAPADRRIINLVVKSVDGGSVGGTILIDGEEAALDTSTTGSVSLTTRLP